MFMGTQANNFTTPGGIAAGADNIKQDVDLFTARINYRFGGPIVARY
jgi:outer membrane immunogenic protein